MMVSWEIFPANGTLSLEGVLNKLGKLFCLRATNRVSVFCGSKVKIYCCTCVCVGWDVFWTNNHCLLFWQFFGLPCKGGERPRTRSGRSPSKLGFAKDSESCQVRLNFLVLNKPMENALFFNLFCAKNSLVWQIHGLKLLLHHVVWLAANG